MPRSFFKQPSLSGCYFYARKLFPDCFFLTAFVSLHQSLWHLTYLFLGQLFLHKQAWMYIGLLQAIQWQVICCACVQLHRHLCKLLNIIAKPRSSYFNSTPTSKPKSEYHSTLSLLQHHCLRT